MRRNLVARLVQRRKNIVSRRAGKTGRSTEFEGISNGCPSFQSPSKESKRRVSFHLFEERKGTFTHLQIVFPIVRRAELADPNVHPILPVGPREIRVLFGEEVDRKSVKETGRKRERKRVANQSSLPFPLA